MVGCSLAVGRDGIIGRGPYNEFAGELIVVDFEVPVRKEKGTAIGEKMFHQDFVFNQKII
jgi:hypothetical protein